MTSRKIFNLVACFIDRLVAPTPPATTVALSTRCEELEEDHAQVWRVHAHVFHKPGVICVVKDFAYLDDEAKVGILLHEFGHLYGGEDDADADLWVEEELGIDIDYVDTIQWVPVEELAI